VDNQEPVLISPVAPATGVGALLREVREKSGRDLATAANTLRIRQPYLEAIEDGRFRDLPGATYAIGFVRGYADYLGLDGNEIVRRFKQENADLARTGQLVFPAAVSENSIPTSTLLALAVVAAGITYGAWHWYQGRQDSAVEPIPEVPDRMTSQLHQPDNSGNEITPPAATAPDQPGSTAMTIQPAPAAPAVALAPAAPVAAPAPPESAAPIQKAEAPAPVPAKVKDKPLDLPVAEIGGEKGRVLLRADEDCWIKIRDASGVVVASRLMHKGDTFAPHTRAGLSMTVGNAGALTVLVDGKPTSSLGGLGMVRHDVPLDPEKLANGTPSEPPSPGPTPAEPAGSEPSAGPSGENAPE